MKSNWSDQDSKVPDNPAVQLWEAMDSYVESVGAFQDVKRHVTRMDNSAPGHYNPNAYMMSYQAVGWGHGLTLGVLGTDRIGRRIYVLGRLLAHRAGMRMLFVLEPSGRFMLPSIMTANERWQISQSTFLVHTWHYRQIVAWARGNSEPQFTYDMLGREHRQVAYYPLSMLQGVTFGVTPWNALAETNTR